jgi:predicted nucleotidyltransferase
LKPENSVLKVLAWFDLFNYPLTAAEIHFFLDQQLPKDELKALLEELVEEKLLFHLGDFYSLQNDESLVVRRINGNQRAKELLAIAHRVSKLLYHFPYVRGIGISGSLSKNFADENADIDLFIITSSNRLWIARTAMHLLKKLTYLRGRQHWFCMNYYIDEEALLIQERNIFTATELITLMPVCGNGAVSHFFNANNWAKNYYPSYADKMPVYKDTGKGYRLKKLLEYVFNNRLGDRLDNYLMKVTTRRWKQKEEKHLLNMRGVRMGLATGKHFSKPSPYYFQKSILEQYQQKLDAVFAKRKLTVD